MNGIFSSIITSEALTFTGFSASLASAIALGALTAFIYRYISKESKGFLVSIAILPPVVALVIMMVNGSLGASVAVAGAFSLVRFRSNPGTAREICAVFLSMAIGLACGIGYPLFAFIFTLVIGGILCIYEKTGFISGKSEAYGKTLNITIPEELDYSDVFSDIFDKYTKEIRLVRIKTTNLGSLNRLTYEMILKNEGTEKKMIDELRCRNGNLEIGISLYGDGTTLL